MKTSLIILLFALTCNLSLAQTDSLINKPKNDKYIWVCIFLEDTTAHSYPYQAGNKYVLYYFEIKSILEGEAETKRIGVCTFKNDIDRPSHSKDSRYYYWGLSKIYTLPDGTPVYRHGSNF